MDIDMLGEAVFSRITPAGKRLKRRPARPLATLAATAAVAALIFAGLTATDSATDHAAAAVTVTVPKATKVKAVKPPKGWKLTFNRTFTGTKLNTKVWATCYWWAKRGSGCTNTGNSNEKQWYLPAQVKVSGNALQLVARRKDVKGINAKGQPTTFACRSGMVTSNPSFNFKYGFIQVVARLPYSKGLWEGLWLAASNHKWPPEVDILEHWDAQAQAKVYLHPLTGARQGGRVYTPANLSKKFNTFTLSWTKTRLDWYIDNYRVFSTRTHVPQRVMYLILNLADTKNGPGTCTGTMAVKSVKIWQP